MPIGLDLRRKIFGRFSPPPSPTQIAQIAPQKEKRNLKEDSEKRRVLVKSQIDELIAKNAVGCAI
jgi:hypothetical protein